MYAVEFCDPEEGTQLLIYDRAEDANAAFNTLYGCCESGCTLSTWEM